VTPAATRVDLSVGEVLDDAAELVAALAAPWAGLLWLTALPLRLAQAHFAARLIELAGEARAYGDHLRWLALLTGGAFLLSLWGRAVFAGACRRRLQGLVEPGALALRPGAAGLVTYAYAALAIEAVFYATCLSIVAAPALALVAGLAAVTLPFEARPGLLRPFSVVSASAGHPLPLVALLAAFGAAFVLVAVNLLVLAQAALWLAHGVAGLDLARWSGLLAPRYPRFLCVLVACGWLLLEPWWLAALAVYVHKLRSRATGEDLRLWFERLRSVES
jgi:hypothetical protein